MLNEEEHIERVISEFLNTKYPNLLEIIIADGGSTDKTRKIVKLLTEKDSRVKLIDNPEKFQSFGLNRIIDQAKGDIFIRADGHCFYNDNYIEKCIEVLLNTGAKNVGGAQRYKASNYVQAGIALAVNSFLGNGGAKYMNDEYEGYADTVFLGCFWTLDLKKLNGFNTDNITNEDAELNNRIIEDLNGQIYISSKIKLYYSPRSTYSALIKQYFKYGRGRYLTNKLHKTRVPLRSKAPFYFVSTLLLYLATDSFLDLKLYSERFFLFVFLVLLFESLKTITSNYKKFDLEIWSSQKKPPSLLSRLVATIFSLVFIQIGYFSGYLFQMIRMRVLKEKGW